MGNQIKQDYLSRHMHFVAITAHNYGRKEMLEQVIEWLKVNTRDGNYATMQRNHTGYGAWAEVNTDELIEDLTAAMRPTTTQDNS